MMMDWGPSGDQRGNGKRVPRRRRPRERYERSSGKAFSQNWVEEEKSCCIECGVPYFHSVFCSQNVEAAKELASYEKEVEEKRLGDLKFAEKDSCYLTTNYCGTRLRRDEKLPGVNSTNEKLKTSKATNEKDEIIRNYKTKIEAMEVNFEEDRRAMMMEVSYLKNALSESQINEDFNRKTILQLENELKTKEDLQDLQNKLYADKFSKMKTELSVKEEENMSLAAKVRAIETHTMNMEKNHELLSKKAACEIEIIRKENSDILEKIENVLKEKSEILKENEQLKNCLEFTRANQSQLLNNLVARNEEYVSKLAEEVERTRTLQKEKLEWRRSLERKDEELIMLYNEIKKLIHVQGMRGSRLEELMKDKAGMTTIVSSQFKRKEAVVVNRSEQINALTQEMKIVRKQLGCVSHRLTPIGRFQERQRLTPFLSDPCTSKNKGLMDKRKTEEGTVKTLNLVADKLKGFAADSIVSRLIKRSAKPKVTSSSQLIKATPVLVFDVPEQEKYCAPSRDRSRTLNSCCGNYPVLETSIAKNKKPTCIIAGEARTDAGKRGKDSKIHDWWVVYLNATEEGHVNAGG